MHLSPSGYENRRLVALPAQSPTDTPSQWGRWGKQLKTGILHALAHLPFLTLFGYPSTLWVPWLSLF